MIIRLIAVGRLRERYLSDGFSDYARRISPYARLEVVEVPESALGSSRQEALAMEKEARSILSQMRPGCAVVSLDREGRSLDSIQLAEWLRDQMLGGISAVEFIIGGPLGLHPLVLERSSLRLSFSKMTFPHQLMRLILIEQLYRAFRILRNEPYHR
ncbi:MAG: rRNA large subunit methyltransferase [Methanosaeta sp. PtaB.Bin039]|nr:MAG: rRNA large subunit methyltransferase [Methanosaeta sp. PtaB.Bin039]OPY47648.1 MAG: rRNA large subunit methyltransferase [Methanosaeta sp. PtaU1.Bin028]HOT07797.1 23S rRNA (pseudouridine(1915)-N(3))-methyltransferase RlmH [Methanotrichaceae archaeon]HQF16401.1 23S rRNA (pseudouridine(1915)-N(3))-methyltransferase RlmH [Methanotrichaceae archaeon]HQI90985.1 23S rRNA (pseudouridine(1915)-N(3))-methyltransferase RlmH [Methanotrichaceae archaeon]